MSFPRTLTRGLRGPVNRLMLHLAGHAAFADLEHRGRRSGTLHHTPVRAFRVGGDVVIGLNFGPRSDWFRNLTAAGGGRLRLGGEHLVLGAPGWCRPRKGQRACPGRSGSRCGTSSGPSSASSSRSWTARTDAGRGRGDLRLCPAGGSRSVLEAGKTSDTMR
ncbi:nitroreductase family deazaflavin-dependent oxidoreductase [Cryptosporangium sp. NPDC051539]|uniref:nitroreductase family deazaflavin-dependent oxidoreductase n=1 Tax=Cryptosporangium sp. NPDC051539 TaxID=3363962 RepID=UPI0037ADC3FB